MTKILNLFRLNKNNKYICRNLLRMILNNKHLLLFLLSSIAVFSQKQVKDSLVSHQLNEVVVTATRTIRQLSSVPLAVTLISKKQIAAAGSTRLKNILEEQTGILFVTDASGFSGVQLQGVESAYTLILINGVPLIGRSAGALDLERVSVSNIKQIEIVKGPSSSLYGSEAIGGVINIITENPSYDIQKSNLYFYGKGGAKEEFDFSFDYLYKKNALGIRGAVNVNYVSAFDLSPSSPAITSEAQQNMTADFGISYAFNKRLDFDIHTRFYQQDQKNGDKTNRLKDLNINTTLKYLLSDETEIDYAIYATQYKTKSIFNDEVSLYNQQLIRPEIRAKIKLDSGELVSGIGIGYDALNRTYFEKKETYTTQYAFAQYDFNPINRLNVIVGARYDHHNKYKSAFSPKISARYEFSNWLSVKSSIGFGFKAPDFRQLFFNFNNSAAGYVVYGVQTMHDLFGEIPEVQQQVPKELNPENSIGYNLGVQFTPINQLKLEINFFRNDIKDLINTAVFNGNLPGVNPATRVFYYENRDQVYTHGIELDFQFTFSNQVKLIAGYQYVEAKDREQERQIKSGEVYYRKTSNSPSQLLNISDYFGLANRSKHMANAKLYYHNNHRNFDANIRAIYRSKYALYDTNNSQEIIDNSDAFVKGNVIINTSISKTFLDQFTLQLGIDNVFDIDGLENVAEFPNNDAVLRLGRTYFTRIQFNF